MSDKYSIRLFILTLMLAALSLSGCGKDKSAGTDNHVDAVAPLFKGIVFSTATDADKITVAWMPASDDVTPLDEISYELYASESADFTPSPNELKKTIIGGKQADITGLSPATTYHLLVIAIDKHGADSK